HRNPPHRAHLREAIVAKEGNDGIDFVRYIFQIQADQHLTNIGREITPNNLYTLFHSLSLYLLHAHRPRPHRNGILTFPEPVRVYFYNIEQTASNEGKLDLTLS